MNLSELKKKDIASLIQIAKDYDIENANGMRSVSYTHLTLPTSDLV